jgi:integrase
MKRRRGHGEGSIYQREDGIWCASIDLGYVNGKRKRKVVTAKTRKEVADKLRVLQQQQQSGVNFAADKQTVESYLTRWLDTVVKETCRPKTYESYEYMCRIHIIPAIGHVQLDKLTPDHVQQMISVLRKKDISDRTVQYAYRILSIAMGRAVKFGYVHRNVVTLVDQPKTKKHVVEPLTVEQAQTFLAAVEGHRLAPLYHIALGLGLRQGEIIALRWSDVDLDQRKLRIRAAKTESGIRTLALPQTLVDTLRQHWQFQQQERLVQGVNWKEHGLVFPSEVGTSLSARNLLRHFKKSLKKAGLPEHIRFHDLRHSCASFLIANGVNPRVVMEILGHSQISVTMNTYAHVFSGVQEDAVTGVADMLASTKQRKKEDR